MMVCGGMARFTSGCMKQGIIENVLEKQGIEKQVYDNRFGIFANIPFPKYIPYEGYKESSAGESQYTPNELFESSKKLMADGKNILQKLVATDEGSRNLKHISKEFLEKV